jgi:hypothetical protein
MGVQRGGLGLLLVFAACGGSNSSSADAGADAAPVGTTTEFWSADPGCSAGGVALTCGAGIEVQVITTTSTGQVLAGTTNWNYRKETLTDSPAQLLVFDGFGSGVQTPASATNLPEPTANPTAFPTCSGFSQLTDLSFATYSVGQLDGDYTVIATGASAYIDPTVPEDHTKCVAHGNVFLQADGGAAMTTDLESALASYYTEQTSEARYVLPYDGGALGCTPTSPCLFAFAAPQSLPVNVNNILPATVWRARVGVSSCASSFFANGVCWDAAPIFEFGVTEVSQRQGGSVTTTTSFFATRMKSGAAIDSDGNVYFGSAGSVADGEAAVYMLSAADDKVWLFYRDATAAQIRGFLYIAAQDLLLVLSNPEFVPVPNDVHYFQLAGASDLPRAPDSSRKVGSYSYALSLVPTRCGELVVAPTQELPDGKAGFAYVPIEQPDTDWSAFFVDLVDDPSVEGFERAIRAVVGDPQRGDVLVGGFDAYVNYQANPPDGDRAAYPSDTAFIKRVEFCGD